MGRISLFNWLIALGAGTLGTLAFAPYNLWPLAITSLALWMWLSIRTPGFLTGFFYGLGLFGSGISWVSVSMVEHGGASLGLAFGMTFIFTAGLALFPGLASWGHAVWRNQWPGPFRQICLLTTCWVTMEVFRSWVLTGFPWLLFGYSALLSPFEGYLSWIGVYGTTTFMALASGGIVTAAIIRKVLPLLLPIFIIGVGSALNSIFSPFYQPELTTRFTLWQPVIPQATKWKPEYLNKILALHVSEGLSQDASIMIWPETALPITESRVNSVLPDLEMMLLKKKQTLITGVLGQKDGSYTNRLITLGVGHGTYDKTRLVPFGEYVPLETILRGIITFFDLPMSHIIPGDQENLLIHKSVRIAPLICYEIAYAVKTRRLAQQANIILTVSNDTWFGNSIGPHQHLQIAQIRARELGKPVIRSTNDGLTAFIDASGRIQSSLNRFKRGMLTYNVIPANTITPYSQAGEVPLVILLIIILAVSRKIDVQIRV